MDKPALTTSILHADRRLGVEHGGIRTPIHTSIQYGYERVEDLIDVFQGKRKGGFNYARQGTPTTAALESKLAALELGRGAVCFSSGMAALTAVFLTLLRAGDHVVSSRFVFGNTHSLFTTLGTLGIEVSRVDAGSAAEVAAALRPNTRMVFVETIANPGTQVPDLEAIGTLCRDQRLLYVVDNTITSPVLFRPRHVGAGLVIHSLSKTIAGHGAALGGAVIDTGEFDWLHCPNIADAYRSADPASWGLLQIRKKGLRDMGASLSSEHAHQIGLGAETMELRVRQSSANALALARYLESHPAVDKVHYPGLPSHPQHETARRCFGAGSWLLSFELRDPGSMCRVINKLRIPIKATGLGDTRTLVIPVAPTIFWEAGAQVRAAMGISDGMVRISAGIEDTDDLIADFEQALAD
ncbi:cystathionine gamma-synthase family protein [Aquabacterium sp. A7-Y]|uniref:cystathionine gamma-synthase family protein n=1 Tax=Aquabacterium sp. A7-Y TaxID=1349605 RepID=UPI00223DB0E5|nr:cystathionine gamma-synthase family protein [Aquabacterium sp. A7-Y]MCW7537508.1 cystathionine gamma-synthase family protein [Aquabacterium sp. A7-Y]